jgi:hypothetical protein
VSLDAGIDDLYKRPLDEFVSARAALAKSVGRDEARLVKALAKPTVVPWSVNQVYWHARDAYARLLKAGEKLRGIQLATLEGTPGDVRAASAAHRQAVADAVKSALAFASRTGARADADQLARTFEALSLVKTPPERHGRFTRPLQPQGFEALAGVAIQAAPKQPPKRGQEPTPASTPHTGRAATPARDVQAERRREREAALAARRRATAVKAAEARLARTRAAEARARAEWDAATRAREDAETALARLRSGAR